MERNQSPKRGFAGFGTLASDVEKEITAAKLAAAEPPSHAPVPARPTTSAPSQNLTTALNRKLGGFIVKLKTLLSAISWNGWVLILVSLGALRVLHKNGVF